MVARRVAMTTSRNTDPRRSSDIRNNEYREDPNGRDECRDDAARFMGLLLPGS
jgi:hypothetical protein